MKLEDLIPFLPQAHVTGPGEGPIVHLTDDSREVRDGSVFVAIRGHLSDGHQYLSVAMEAGASVIVAQSPPVSAYSGTWIQVADSKQALAIFADLFFASPSADLNVIAITGTNGKTTIAYLTHSILQQLRHRAGMIGTIVVNDGVKAEHATHTTPGLLQLQSLLARMRDNGCGGVAMEVSSHGLEQGRTKGVQFKVGVFSNLTQDHLDYHKSMEAYFEAKKILFTDMAASGSKGTAVINGDDPAGDKLLKDFEGRLNLVSYGFGNRCDFRPGRIQQNPHGTEFELFAKGKSFLVRVPLIGRFNVMNTVAALAAVDAVGVSLREAIAAIKNVTGVPGRLELVGMKGQAAVFVDYAHTPDALQNVCRTLRELEPDRLITVFGCGGDRDRGKRAPMARAAEKDSDYCIVTSDNPRSENPENILTEIAKGFTGRNYFSISDRKEAIQQAIAIAKGRDIVLIAGKGHEDYQIFKNETITFDDRVEARKAIELAVRLQEREEL